MAVFKWLNSTRLLLTKEILSIGGVRRFCTDAEPPKSSKADRTTLPAERERIDLETKLRYMKSNAYKTAYGDLPVYTVYVRNHKGATPPKPRKSCIRCKQLTSNNPCPICRDKYLVAHYRNIDLIKQFIVPSTGQIIDNRVTGVCQKQHFRLKSAIHKAKNLGLLSYPVPFRHYNYSDYQN